MRAAIYEEYGSPEEVLKIKEVDMPKPSENEVLVKVKCTAINDWDWSMVRGKPKLYRLMFGIVKPKNRIPGMELSGVVEAIGTNVKNFKIGDAVYGDTSEFSFGTFAEYVCVNEKSIVHKPFNMSFEVAAAVSHASLLAYQSIYGLGKGKKVKKVLINGAGGGFGTSAFYLLKNNDTEITGVDSGNKLSMMKKLGFDHIIDYRKEDFTKNGIKYDLILDAKTNRSIFTYARSLKNNGNYFTVGGSLNYLISILILNPLFRLTGKKNFRILALNPNNELEKINQLYENGQIKFIIDGPYPFEEIAGKLQYFGNAKHSGKVIISIQ
ncbi:NAD(P)-dependent alcohol dehydrogenase [Hyphobacterium sp. CCMP332]|nr:NAD(P)-dependent alcohol dehydrogenase [Hyphobacterium sp. CCMP332]